jgi:tRNA dimethylallyltransferase
MNSIAASAASEAAVTNAPPDTAELALASPVACIVGPTAAGKSALGMQLAEARGLAIVSADSRQLYRGFDIGTAKPSADEQRRVPHFGIDIAEPAERYSARQWAEQAAQWCRSSLDAGVRPVIVGGTGLYVRALVHPLDAVPALDAARRAELEPLLAAMPVSELQRWCTRLDPSRAHLGRTQWLRAVETALLAGTRLSAHLGQREPAARPARYLVVDPGPVLADRIERRVHDLITNGFVEEIVQLRQQIPPDAPAWKASGYGAVRDAVEGRCTLDAAVARVVIETRQYAKRQRTWFRHQLPAAAVTHVNPAHREALDQALAWWDGIPPLAGVNA